MFAPQQFSLMVCGFKADIVDSAQPSIIQPNLTCSDLCTVDASSQSRTTTEEESAADASVI